MTPTPPTTGPPHAPVPGSPGDRAERRRGPALVVSDSDAPPPDIVVTGNRLYVTLDLQGIPADAVAHFLGTNLLVVWQKDKPQESARMVRLPVDIEPGEAIVRVTNNILDVAAPTTRERRAAGSVPPTTSTESNETPTREESP